MDRAPHHGDVGERKRVPRAYTLTRFAPDLLTPRPPESAVPPAYPRLAMRVRFHGLGSFHPSRGMARDSFRRRSQ